MSVHVLNASEHQYYIVDPEAPEFYDPRSTDPEAPANGLIVKGTGCITVWTGTGWGVFELEVVQLDAPPDSVETEAWDVVVDFSLDSDGRARIVEFGFARPQEPIDDIDLAAGAPRFRLHVRGRDEANTLEATRDTLVEFHKLMCWPAPVTEAVFHKNEDTFGRSMGRIDS